MTYTEAVRWLYSLTRIGIKPGLEVTRRLAALAGDPQVRLRFIHVAGTNGKGSVCAFLESVYRRAGLRVGLYTSPHLVCFRERAQVDRDPIGEEEVARWLTTLRGLAEADGLRPTFFEYVTVMALCWFAERRCDLVVLETGMGGRLDSTNIVTPLVAVITDIGMDHAAYLGDTIAAIAGEKAGIIKRGVPVVTVSQRSEAAEVVCRRAEESGSPLTVAADLRWLLPGYRRRNAGLAKAVVEVLNADAGLVAISPEEMQEGFDAAFWPGRLQLVRQGARSWLLDGAHNEDGLRALLEALPEFVSTGGRCALILGVLADKEIGGVVRALGEAFESILLVPIKSVRGGDLTRRAEEFRQAEISVRVATDLPSAMAATDADLTVIAGSFYLVGEALELLDAVPLGLRSERELNEYGR